MYGGRKLKHQLKFRIPSLNLYQPHALFIRCNYRQNADLLQYYSKGEKVLSNAHCGAEAGCQGGLNKGKAWPKKPVPPPKDWFDSKKPYSSCIRCVECKSNIDQQSQEALVKWSLCMLASGVMKFMR